MNNKKTTKRALLSSVMAIVLCLAMLIGTTFAWFTDSASTAVNKIQAGKLDIALEMKNADGSWVPAEGQTLTWKKAAGAPAGEQILWEPGATYALPELRIVNKGNLALKYKVVFSAINGDEDAMKLAEVLDVSLNGNKVGTLKDALTSTDPDGFAHGNLPAEGTSGELKITVQMQTTAGNDYQGLSIGGIAVTVVATQDTVEYDSNNNTYDADAVYPVVTETEFKSALDAIATKGTIVLGDNISLIDTPITIANGKDITIDTSNYTIKSTWKLASSSAAFNVQQNSVLTLKGNGSIEAYAENPDVTWSAGFPGYANNAISNHGTLVIDGATVKVTTDKVGENGKLGASYCVDCYAGSKLQVKSGSIVNAQNIAVRIFTSSASDSVDVTIDGGTIEGSRGIWLQLAGSSSNVAPKVNLVINGGNIKTNEPFDDSSKYCNALYSYSYNNSFVNTNVTINGGHFLGYVAFGGGYKGDRETVTINGGTFEAYKLDGGTLVRDNDCVGRYTSTGWESIAH